MLHRPFKVWKIEFWSICQQAFCNIFVYYPEIILCSSLLLRQVWIGVLPLVIRGISWEIIRNLIHVVFYFSFCAGGRLKIYARNFWRFVPVKFCKRTQLIIIISLNHVRRTAGLTFVNSLARLAAFSHICRSTVHRNYACMWWIESRNEDKEKNRQNFK